MDLAQRAGQPLTRERIQGAVWDDPDTSDPRQVDYHIARIRKKLEIDPAAPQVLLTRVGTGYEWQVSVR